MRICGREGGMRKGVCLLNYMSHPMIRNNNKEEEE